MTTNVVKHSLEKQIQKLNHQDDLNRLAKKKNDKELDDCCDTCKMYIGVILTCCVFLYLVILIVVTLLIRFSK